MATLVPSSSSAVAAAIPDGSIRLVSGSGFRYVTPFPWRLHEMLEAMESSPEESQIVSWLPPDYNTFKVHNSQEFTKKIIPSWFKHKCYKSFQRQLHLYSFRRIQKGPRRGAYFHIHFVRENRQMTHMIRREKAPKAKPRTSRQNSKSSQKSSQHPRRKTNYRNSHTRQQQQQQQQHNIKGETSMAMNPTLSKHEAYHRSNDASTKIDPSHPFFPLYSNNKSNKNNTDNDQDMNMNPRCIDMSHAMLISDTDSLRQSMAPAFNKNCADDIISLFGNIDGASLTKDDLDDFFGGDAESLSSDNYTIVSQSSSSSQCPTSYTQGCDKNHSADNYTDDSSCLFDTDMDLILNDDEFTHDIISLFDTSFQ